MTIPMTNEELEKELGATREALWKLQDKFIILEKKVNELEKKNKFDRAFLLDLDK